MTRTTRPSSEPWAIDIDPNKPLGPDWWEYDEYGIPTHLRPEERDRYFLLTTYQRNRPHLLILNFTNQEAD
jgi:hypothetical protein